MSKDFSSFFMSSCPPPFFLSGWTNNWINFNCPFGPKDGGDFFSARVQFVLSLAML